jgi:glycosyltransferase involved in cell wall biosynthesis
LIKENKICFFNATPFWGGGEKLHLEYAIEFKKRNYAVCIVSKEDSPLYKESLKNKIETKAFTIGNLSFLNKKKQLRLVKYFLEAKIDTVFISASPDLKIASFAAKKAGVKNIIYLRGLAAPIKNTFLNRKILNKAVTHIIANSQETKKKVLGNFNNKELDEKVKVIYHGIDLEIYDKEAKNQQVVYERIGNELIIGNAGRLTKQKGQVHLIEVAKKLKEKGVDFKLLIAGSGEEEERLKAQTLAYGLKEEVVFLGFVKHMEGFMKTLDVFVLTSVWEGFGYVLVEAMAAGKPVIAFDITSNPEIVSNKNTGYLVPHPNETFFTNKIIALNLSPELRDELGENGRKRVETKFQLAQIIQEIETYLKLV